MNSRKSDHELEIACQRERANWMAKRYGLPAIGASLANKFGINWTVHSHMPVPTVDTLNRWRKAEIEPELDLYPAVLPENLSPLLTEFIAAIDRCTTKTFTILDTMPGRRKDGHVPGGNYIDTVCHPKSNLLFLDAASVHETVVAHEFGHAWVQYVDECEDFRTLHSAENPQRARLVNNVQSFVLDLKVNNLLRRKGFDMSFVEEDQTVSLAQLALGLQKGYRPQYASEEVFMALLVADELIRRENGHMPDLVRFDRSMASISAHMESVATLAKVMVATVSRLGFDTRSSVIQCIDECLATSFAYCAEFFDIDQELVLVNPPEPDQNKFPNWLPVLPSKLKCQVGKYMALNEVSSAWSCGIEPTVTARARVTFRSPDRERRSDLVLQHEIGPPTRYSGMPEIVAENLAQKHFNQTGSYQLHGGPPHPINPQYDYDPRQPTTRPKGSPSPQVPAVPQHFSPGRPSPLSLGRSYMAGLGRFLTAARLAEQIAGEHPYGYAFNSPTTYTDPSGLSPGGDLTTCINMWVALGYSPRAACQYCQTAQGYCGGYNCNSLPTTGAPIVPGKPTRGYGNPIEDPTVIFSSVFRYGTAYPGMNYTICLGTCGWTVRQVVKSPNSGNLNQTCVAACNALRQGGCELLWIRCFRMGLNYQKENCLTFYNFICSGT